MASLKQYSHRLEESLYCSFRRYPDLDFSCRRWRDVLFCDVLLHNNIRIHIWNKRYMGQAHHIFFSLIGMVHMLVLLVAENFRHFLSNYDDQNSVRPWFNDYTWTALLFL